MRVQESMRRRSAGASFAPARPRTLQRKCACGGSTKAGSECEECKQKKLQRKTTNVSGATTAPPIVHEVLRSPGQPLDTGTRAFYEPRFGHDFSKVRVHTDEKAAESARSVNALAYTVGQNIVFDVMRLAPSSPAGRKTLAHELTHVIQQSSESMPTSNDVAISDPSDAAEQQAERVATSVLTGSPTTEKAIRPTAILSRQPPYEPYEPRESKCDMLCKSLLSMRNAVEGVCRIAGENDPQCVKDRARLTESEKKIAAAGCQCPEAPAPERKEEPVQPKVTAGKNWALCDRKSSKRASGFKGDTSGTYISAIVVDIKPNTYSTATLTWANSGLSPDAKTLPTSLTTSPGAGICSTDCSDVGKSNKEGSHCTGIGSFTVQGYDCQLPGDDKAKFVTWFDRGRGIAFHYYDVPDHPASHGCARLETKEGGAEWIYDNTLPSITSVTVNRNAADGPGAVCWAGEKSLINRPEPKKETKKKQ